MTTISKSRKGVKTVSRRTPLTIAEQARISAGVSEKNLAQAAQISVNYLRNIERGYQRNLCAHTAFALADALKISPMVYLDLIHARERVKKEKRQEKDPHSNAGRRKSAGEKKRK